MRSGRRELSRELEEWMELADCELYASLLVASRYETVSER